MSCFWLDTPSKILSHIYDVGNLLAIQLFSQNFPTEKSYTLTLSWKIALSESLPCKLLYFLASWGISGQFSWQFFQLLLFFLLCYLLLSIFPKISPIILKSAFRFKMPNFMRRGLRNKTNFTIMLWVTSIYQNWRDHGRTSWK